MSQSDIFWDGRLNVWSKGIPPGGFDVTDREDLVLSTLLGSCVAACIRDTETGFGGLNHFLLPGDPDGGGNGYGGADRYGVNAMETLINAILRGGGQRGRLEAKLFGGGAILDMTAGDTVGSRNATFAREYMRSEGIPVKGEDLGGPSPRRIYFSPFSGKVKVQRLARSDAVKVSAEEKKLKDSASKPKSGAVELF